MGPALKMFWKNDKTSLPLILTKLGELCWVELDDHETKAVGPDIAAHFQGKTPALDSKMCVLYQKKDLREIMRLEGSINLPSQM